MIKRINLPAFAFGTLVFFQNTFPVVAQHSPSGEATNVLVIASVSVAGKSVSLGRGDEVKLGTYPNNIMFRFGPNTNQGQLPIRLRYKLEGHDGNWREVEGEMFLAVRYFNT